MKLNVNESLKLIDEEIHGYCGEEKKWIIIDSEAETSSEYGENPFNRPLNRALKLGVLNIDKPPGPTSHEVVAWIKRMLSLSRAGHGGTLELGGC